MQEFKYDRVHTPAAHEAARQEIARKMAAFEAANGPVETLPIRTDDKRIPYRITCPEKKASDRQKAARTLRGRENPQIKIRAANVGKVRPYIGIGISQREIARLTDLSLPTVRSIRRELEGAA